MKHFPKVYGTVTVGARGQVVIPSKLRRLLDIKSGDSLIVMSNHARDKKMINLIPSNEFSRFLKQFEEHISTVKEQLSKRGKQ